MKRNILLLFITITALSLSAYGQNKSFADLTLNLTPLKSRVLLMEPIPFRVALVNNTDAPIAGVAVSINFSSRAIKLEIKKPNGKVVVPEGLSGMNVRTFPQLFPQELTPGNKIETTQVFDSGHYLFFGKPGEYQVRASVTNSDGKVVYSDWMDLSVVEPAGLDKQAYDYLLNKMKKHPNDFIPFNKWTTDEMEEFVLQYPGTTYADYVRYTLGRTYYEREKEKAEAHFRQIRDKNFVYAEDVSERLKKLEQQLKESDQ